MAVEATGKMSLPLFYLRATVAGSSTFQTWVSADDATEALDSIYVVSVDKPTAGWSSILPFAVVDWADNLSFRSYAGGIANEFTQSGDLFLTLWSAVDPTHSDADAAMTFLNTVGAIEAEMELLAGLGGYLDISEITRESGPSRPMDDEAETSGDVYEMVLRISYGQGGAGGAE